MTHATRDETRSTSELQNLRLQITHRDGTPPDRLQVERRPLRGGLESTSIEQLTVRYRDRMDKHRTHQVVVKRLTGTTVREADIYERFVTSHVGELSPRLLSLERPSPGHAVLYLEALRPVSTWPWRDRQAARSVLQRAARLHAREPAPAAEAALSEWDYESELEYMAFVTLERLEDVRRQRGRWSFGGGLRWARRIVEVLPELRRQLLEFEPFGSSVIHGDLHPGNVVMRRRDARTEPILLDWGRARIGSPLEDVSCWLQSLGTWEPEARRRHDSLLMSYLAAWGLEPKIDTDLRAAYWMAGASNALSGALVYHLSVVLDDSLPNATRASAAYSAREWVRVLRRADSFWS